MKKIARKFLLFALPFCFFCPSGCEPQTHSHTQDSFGFCSTCKQDLAEELVRDQNGVYVGESHYAKKWEDYFFKAEMNGETSLEIFLSTQGALLSNVYVYDEELTLVASLPLIYEGAVTSMPFVYEAGLTAGKTYRFKVHYAEEGLVALRMRSNG